MSAGFFIYGPQALVGIAAANIATKRAAATAGGFCGLFGYGSTIVSGWGMGMLVQYTDWRTNGNPRSQGSLRGFLYTQLSLT